MHFSLWHFKLRTLLTIAVRGNIKEVAHVLNKLEFSSIIIVKV